MFVDKLNELKNKQVSLLLDLNKNNLLKESYCGIVEEVGEDYVVLNPNNPSFFIKRLYIKKELIISVWELDSKIYKPPSQR